MRHFIELARWFWVGVFAAVAVWSVALVLLTAGLSLLFTWFSVWLARQLVRGRATEGPHAVRWATAAAGLVVGVTAFDAVAGPPLA